MGTLGQQAVGSTIKLNLNGSPREFLIMHQGNPSTSLYDASCNGTWVRMKEAYENRQWDSSNNDYANSDVDAWLNGAFLNMLDQDIREQGVKQVKIPYRPGSGYGGNVNTGANGLSRKAFLLGMREMGLSPSYSPNDGVTLAYYSGGGTKVINLNGSPARAWSRSPHVSGDGGVVCSVEADGSANVWSYTYSCAVAPALILNSELSVSDDGTVSTNEPPTAPGSISVSGVVASGTATITLTAATDPDGTIASYRYERSVDSGSWTQFADVNSLTQTDSVSGDWGTVAYRACAVDDAGEAGPYATSETETVNDGYLLIGGPASNMGSKSEPFTFEATVGVSGETGVTGIEASMWLDYVRVYHESVNQGATLEYEVDTRVMSSGQHTIQVTLEKDDYLPANAAYYFTVPSQGLPDGGASTQLRNDHGNPVFPRTTTRDVIGPNGLTVQNEIENLQKAHRGATGHLEHIDTVLGPASNVEWTREANTAYATRLYPSGLSASKIFLQTFNSAASGAQSLGDAQLNFEADTITLTSLSSNTMLELLKYVLDSHVATPPDPTVNFTPLEQPKVSTAATNTGTSATDLNDALNQMLETYPDRNNYLLTSTDGDVTYYVTSVDKIDANTTSKTVAYVASTNPTKWYDNVQMTFINTTYAPNKPDLTLGNVISWAGQTWIVSHVTSTEAYLTRQALDGESGWGNLQSACNNWASKLNASARAYLKSVTAGNTSGNVFVATYAQMNGGFSYFNSNGRRSINENYWTSTADGSYDAWFVDRNGRLYSSDDYFNLSEPLGFRPSVCIDLTLL